MLYVCVAVLSAESVTSTVNDAGTGGVPVVTVVAFPLMTPKPERVSPAGSDPPVNCQAYGDVPPVAASVAVYILLVFPTGSALVVIVTCAHAITGNRTDNAIATRPMILAALGFLRN
jgi:hypothetical protein